VLIFLPTIANLKTSVLGLMLADLVSIDIARKAFFLKKEAKNFCTRCAAGGSRGSVRAS
jgi:hypothetical protein